MPELRSFAPTKLPILSCSVYVCGAVDGYAVGSWSHSETRFGVQMNAVLDEERMLTDVAFTALNPSTWSVDAPLICQMGVNTCGATPPPVLAMFAGRRNPILIRFTPGGMCVPSMIAALNCVPVPAVKVGVMVWFWMLGFCARLEQMLGKKCDVVAAPA